MKFKVDQAALNQTLSILSRSVASHPQLPVLANIKLSTNNGQLELAATDLQTGVVITLDASIKDKGETTVPAKVFSDLVASLPPQEIKGEFEDNILKLSCGSFTAKINCLSAEEFPIFPQVGKDPIISFSAETFGAIVNKVAFAAAIDDSRPVLAGVLIKATSKGLVFIATDGYRMSQLIDTSVKDLDFEAIVPARSLIEVTRTAASLPEIEGIALYASEGNRQLMFSLGKAIISTRFIEGKFPNTDKIIPTEHKTRAEVELEEFGKAVKVAQVFARDSANVVRLEFDPKGKVTLLANTKQVGSNTGIVDAVVEGEKNKVAFNVRYLIDVLGILEEERFELTMSEPLKPGVFRSLGESEPFDFLHLIMPVRVQE
jgi:DNA polymerase-3 subunit beta